MKGGLKVGCRLEILCNVRSRLGNETVSVGLKWGVKCRATKSECRCRATLILGCMSVSDGKNGSVSDVWNTPFMGPTRGQQCIPCLPISARRGHYHSAHTTLNYIKQRGPSLIIWRGLEESLKIIFPEGKPFEFHYIFSWKASQDYWWSSAKSHYGINACLKGCVLMQ